VCLLGKEGAMRRLAVLGVAVFAVGAVLGGALWPTAGAQGVCATPTAGGGLVFEGVGDDVTEPFALTAGTIVVTAHAEGTGPLFVTAHIAPGLGVTDKPPALILGVQGPYDGRTAFKFASDAPVILDVDHDGPWRIEVEQ
jgi:hypothetical protein